MQGNRSIASALVVAGILGFALGLVPVAVTEPDDSSFLPGLGNAIRSAVVLAFGSFLVPIIPASVIGGAGGVRRSRWFWILVGIVVAAILIGSAVGYATYVPDDGAAAEELADLLSLLATEAIALTVIASAGALLGYVGGGRLGPDAGRASGDPLVWLAGLIAIVFSALGIVVLSVAANIF